MYKLKEKRITKEKKIFPHTPFIRREKNKKKENLLMLLFLLLYSDLPKIFFHFLLRRI